MGIHEDQKEDLHGEVEIGRPSQSHSHHGRDRHHSSYRHGSRKKRIFKRSFDKVNRFVKKYKKTVFSVLTLILLGVFVLAIWEDRASVPAVSQGGGIRDTAQMPVLSGLDKDRIYIGLPDISGKVRIVRPEVVEYMNTGKFTMNDSLSRDSYAAEVPVKLNFDVQNLPETQKIHKAVVEVADNEQFADSSYFELDANYAIRMSHLKTDTTYYYRVSFTLDDGIISAGGMFETEDTPRVLSIEGITNVRDVGGWETTDGRELKQGLLYRGTELDGAVEGGYKLTTQGVTDMVRVLGIRTDLDLRLTTDSVPGTYILGANVDHVYYPVSAYNGIFEDYGKEQIRQVFSFMAKPEKYPMYLHCTYGMDRTGTVCYLLEAMLGVSEGNLLKDYGLSELANGATSEEKIMTVFHGLQSYPGGTLKEKTENYLLSIGVTHQEIASIRAIFLK